TGRKGRRRRGRGGGRRGQVVGLRDPPKQARKAIMRAVTDSRPAVDFAVDLAPGVVNLLTIYECLTGTTREQSREHFEGAQYGALKAAVADVVVELLERIQKRYHEIVDERAQLQKLLTKRANWARAIAADTSKPAQQ